MTILTYIQKFKDVIKIPLMLLKIPYYKMRWS